MANRTVSGVVFRSDVATASGRIYSAATIERALGECQQRLAEGQLYGEFITTNSPHLSGELSNLQRIMTISATDITHRVTKLELVDGAVYAEVELTRHGEALLAPLGGELRPLARMIIDGPPERTRIKRLITFDLTNLPAR